MEHIAGAPTRHRLPILLHRQLRWAIVSQVSIAPRRAAVSFATRRLYCYREIEAIHNTDIIVINRAKGKVSKGGRPASRTSTVQHFPTATGLTFPVSILVEVAACSCPYPTSPRVGDGVDGGLATLEGKSTAGKVSSGCDGRPYCILA